MWRPLRRSMWQAGFHGGLSTQRLCREDSRNVRAETSRLLEMGREGSYIFAPAHDVQGDVSLENMLAFIDLVQAQPAIGISKE